MIADMKGTIAGALNQAERFVTELVNRGSMEVTADNREKVTIDAACYQKVFRVSVTLDLISSASTALWKLSDAGIATSSERCWSVSLNDLRVIVEILDQPALFLHYLVRRVDINMVRSVEARDELDYLMHHAKLGLFFREGNAPQADEHVILNGFTEELDQYYRRVQGISNLGSKPRVRVGKRTQRILTTLQSKLPDHWASACMAILEFDIPVREELLGKLLGQLKQMQQPRAGYALSLSGNFETGGGLALATSKQPSQAREIVEGRCANHCRQNQLKAIWIILLGVPIQSSAVHILRVTSDTIISNDTSRLLDQLDITVNEYRKTGPAT